MKRYLFRAIGFGVCVLIVVACGQAAAPAGSVPTQAVVNTLLPTAKAAQVMDATATHAPPAATRSLQVTTGLGATPGSKTPDINSPVPLLKLPDLKDSPKTLWIPQEITFKSKNDKSCAPEGSTNPGNSKEKQNDEAETNLLKNRVDVPAAYYNVAFDSVMKIAMPPWPTGIENRANRNQWSKEDMAAVEKYEGLPIAIAGYLYYESGQSDYGAKDMDPESSNCYIDDTENHDFHIWLVKDKGGLKDESIVVEATPRVRPQHPKWTVANLKLIAKEQKPVRISGWLFLDPEHPENVKNAPGNASKSRGTIWEIHPIMRIEVGDSATGPWTSLDDLGEAAIKPGPYPTPQFTRENVPLEKWCGLLSVNSILRTSKICK